MKKKESDCRQIIILIYYNKYSCFLLPCQYFYVYLFIIYEYFCRFVVYMTYNINIYSIILYAIALIDKQTRFVLSRDKQSMILYNKK